MNREKTGGTNNWFESLQCRVEGLWFAVQGFVRGDSEFTCSAFVFAQIGLVDSVPLLKP